MIMKHQKVWNRMVEVNDTSYYFQAHGWFCIDPRGEAARDAAN